MSAHFRTMVHPLLFYAVAGLTIVGALGVTFARDPVYAVLSLVVALFGLSALFVGLGAYFVAVIQVLVYAGAVLILFLFVVMLLDMAPERLLQTRDRTLTFFGVGFALIFLAQLTVITTTFLPRPSAPGIAAPAPVPGTTAEVGRLLFTTYALPFEVASLILLVGIIGAVALAKKRST